MKGNTNGRRPDHQHLEREHAARPFGIIRGDDVQPLADLRGQPTDLVSGLLGPILGSDPSCPGQPVHYFCGLPYGSGAGQCRCFDPCGICVWAKRHCSCSLDVLAANGRV